MSELIKIFKFYDEFSIYSHFPIKIQPYYELTIIVREDKNDIENIEDSEDNISNYNITYKNNFIRSSTLPNEINKTILLRANPLANLETEHKEGIYVVKNSLTEKIVEYLLMDFSDLKKVSGMTTPQQYKILIIEMLTKLWD